MRPESRSGRWPYLVYWAIAIIVSQILTFLIVLPFIRGSRGFDPVISAASFFILMGIAFLLEKPVTSFQVWLGTKAMKGNLFAHAVYFILVVALLTVVTTFAVEAVKGIK